MRGEDTIVLSELGLGSAAEVAITRFHLFGNEFTVPTGHAGQVFATVQGVHLQQSDLSS